MSDAAAEWVEDRGAADEVAGCADQAAEEDVDAVVEGAGRVVQVAPVSSSGKVGAAVDVERRAVCGRGRGVLWEVRVVADREGDIDAANSQARPVSTRGEDCAFARIEVLLVVGSHGVRRGASTRSVSARRSP